MAWHLVVKNVLCNILSSSVTCLIMSYHLVLFWLLGSCHSIEWHTPTQLHTYTPHSHSNKSANSLEYLQERHWRISCGLRSLPSQTSRSVTLAPSICLSLRPCSLFWLLYICLQVCNLICSQFAVYQSDRNSVTHIVTQSVTHSLSQSVGQSIYSFLIIWFLYECFTRRQATGCGQQRWRERELRYVTRSTVQCSVVL